MNELLIAAPLRLEAALISSGAPGLRVTRVGMGPQRSRDAVGALCADQARALIVMGVCGGLRGGDRPGEVIIADEVRAVDHDGRPQDPPVPCSGAKLLTEALSQRGLKVRTGTIASSPVIVHGAGRSRLAEWGAAAVEMEAAWLAPGARGRPFAVIRVVADTPVADLRRPDLALRGWLLAARRLRSVAGQLERVARSGGLAEILNQTA